MAGNIIWNILRRTAGRKSRPTGEIIWEDVAYELEPGGSLEKSWDLESAYGALDGGQYRIGIPCEEQNGDGSAAAVIYVEFGI